MNTNKTDFQHKIGEAIESRKPLIILPSNTKPEIIRSVIRKFMRNHPEIFWFSNQYAFNEKTGELSLKYNFSAEKIRYFKNEIVKVISEDFQIEKVKGLNELEKVVYVYKWIANRTTYNEYSSFNQTIYSVLINRNSVCTGYAKTAQYLLKVLGIESKLVFGKLHSDKSRNGRHGWNLVKIDGTWHHIDFCLADKSLSHLLNCTDVVIDSDTYLWNYFGVSTEKILTNRSIENFGPLPECTETIQKIPQVKLLPPKKELICCKSISGTTSKVYLDSFDKTKVIKVSRENDWTLLRHENEMLERLSGSRHIIKPFGLTKTGLELEQLTPLGELLASHYYNPNEKQLTDILIQLAEGLIECRNKGITYTDIHYNNIFVSKDGVYKWGDFGIAFSSTPDNSLHQQMIGKDGVALGSRWFMAPETFLEGVFTESSAIYSLGMLAYFIMNDRNLPLSEHVNEQSDVWQYMVQAKPLHTPALYNQYHSLWKVLKGYLTPNINNRTATTLSEFISKLKKPVVLPCGAGAIAPNKILTGQNSSEVSKQSSKNKRHNSYHLQEFDYDVFARTALVPGNSILHENTQGISFIPQKNAIKKVRRLVPRLKSFCNFWRNSSENYFEDIVEEAEDYINSCVFAPAKIQPNKTFIIRVYLYKSSEDKEVEDKIQKIDPKAEKKEYKPLSLPVKVNDLLTVQLKMSDGVSLDSDTKNIVWHNHFTDCSFLAKLTSESISDVYGTAYILVNGIPAGELLFTIDVCETASPTLYAKIESRNYSSIFISYSHVDDIQVRGFAECCKALGTNYFFDRHSLKPGDLFKEKIFDYINRADLFVLCWSKNAAESEWVQIEREHALRLIQEGKSSLSIYPLCLRPEAPLPADMSDKYNFGKL